jgi:hypothetical protein
VTLTRALGSVAIFASMALASGCLLVTPLGDHAKSTGGNGGAPTTAKTGGRGGVSGAADATDGTTPESSCTTNEECIKRLGLDAPASYFCRRADHACVALKTEECPLAYGEAANPNAIFIGAFATLDPARLEDNSIVWAHRLALEEISKLNVGGLPSGPDGGTRRPLVMVVCNNDAKTVSKGLAHLADDIRVPAVLATLMPEDLQTGFEAHRARKVFYLSPVGVTSAFANQPNDHLIWHMLGQPADLAPAYRELLTLAEKYSRTQRGIGSRPVRVALVTSTDAFDADLSNFVIPALTFNGKSTAENDTARNYQGFTIDPAGPTTLGALGVDVVNFRPDIVISTAGAPFTQTGGIFQTIETYWQDTHTADAGRVGRPFYILSPINAGDLTGVQKVIQGFIDSKADLLAYERIVGVSAAGAEDKTLQNAYATRLRTRFTNAYPDSGNYYDAFYFLAYAMYGAASLTGPDIASGMQRLIGGGPAYGVGPDDIHHVFEALAVANQSIELDGTIGPPNFDPNTGSREDDGSVFCFGYTQSILSLRSEVLRYHHDTGMLTGSFPCFPGFFP